MKKIIISLALVLTALSSYAITPLWMRDARISPDGKEIVFCYKGDIYKVPVQGGTATQLTTQASYEANPVWSPDGKQIAFASDRNGNFDLFIMSADGGTARRLTYHSASEIPSAFTPDGKFVLFSVRLRGHLAQMPRLLFWMKRQHLLTRRTKIKFRNLSWRYQRVKLFL